MVVAGSSGATTSHQFWVVHFVSAAAPWTAVPVPVASRAWRARIRTGAAPSLPAAAAATARSASSPPAESLDFAHDEQYDGAQDCSHVHKQ